MTTQLLPLSQEALFNHAQAAEPWGLGPVRRRLGSISTRRNSSVQAKDQLHPRHPPLFLRGVAGAYPLPEASYLLSPSVSNPNSPSVPLGKRFSFGAWLQGGWISFSGLHLHQPAPEVRLENTRRVGPEQGCLFNASQAQQIIQATLESYLDGACYNPATCSQLSQILADLVRSKIKDVNAPRYKLVCQVVVGQRGNQGLRVASRCLLDSKTDHFAAGIFQNHSLFTVAVVHGMYFE